MSQDNRLMPVSPLDRSLDRPLADFVQAKPYGTSGLEPTTFRDYLFVVLKRKWLILSLVIVVTSLVTIQLARRPSMRAKQLFASSQERPTFSRQKSSVITGQTDPNFGVRS